MLDSSSCGKHLKSASREIVLSMWAGELRMSLPELLQPNHGVWLSPNREFDEIVVIQMGSDVRISVPVSRIREISAVMSSLPPSNYCDPEFWRTYFPGMIGSLAAPARFYYLDTDSEAIHEKRAGAAGIKVRGLAASDLKLCGEFASALTWKECEASGLDTMGRHMWGVFRDGVLASIATYDVWPGRIAHIGVATRVQFRRQGLARRAASAAIHGILRRRRIAQFRCEADDVAGNALARALGFIPMIETLSIRLPLAK